jgi:hypothetical protein
MITDTWVELVESTGIEMPVTLLVSGAVLVGTLTPWLRYAMWQQEVSLRATHEVGSLGLPVMKIGPISRDLAMQIAESWEERKLTRSLPPDYENEDNQRELTFPEFALRDAEIRIGIPQTWRRYPFLVVRANTVQAMFPAEIRQPDEDSEEEGP